MPEIAVPSPVVSPAPASASSATAPIQPIASGRAVDPGRSRRSIALVIPLVLIPLLLDQSSDRPEWLLLGILLGTVAVLVFVIEMANPGWHASRLVPATFYFVAIAALRHSAGGADSGYSALVLLGILMLAFLGTRRDLIVGIVLITVVLALPIVIFGAPEYPLGEWRRVLFTAMVAAFIGIALQRLMDTLSRETQHTKDQADALERQTEITTAILDTATDAVVSFDGRGRVTAANPAAEALLGRSADAMVGATNLLDLVADADRDRLQAGLARWRSDSPLADRDRRFEAEMVHASGAHVPVEVTITRTQGPYGPRFHAFSRDITGRRAVERADREHLDDLARLLSVAEDLGRTSVDGRSVICAAACDFAEADFALLYTLDASRGRLIVTGSAGRAEAPTDIELDPDRSVAGDALRSGEPVFIGDLDADPRIDKSITVRVGAAAAFLQPIAVDGRPVGVLVAYWRAPVAGLPQRTQTMFRLFATQAAVAVERADLLARLELLARTDPLTGASNRRAMEENLTRILAGAPRGRRPVSVVMLDLDNFKRYNDSHGHQAGDGLLRDVVANWQAQLRPNDELARYGGEEFLVILPDCDLATAGGIADRLRSVVPDGETVSAGVAQWDGLETSTVLIARSDTALYAAKAAGRDRTMLGVAPIAAIAREG